ncbi:MAG: HEAT repeat domain-containing protein [Planctomycetes bacterium]|nr:HEAT repeat domain-containing protein [Planctomycetota bacterium]
MKTSSLCIIFSLMLTTAVYSAEGDSKVLQAIQAAQNAKDLKLLAADIPTYTEEELEALWERKHRLDSLIIYPLHASLIRHLQTEEQKVDLLYELQFFSHADAYALFIEFLSDKDEYLAHLAWETLSVYSVSYLDENALKYFNSCMRDDAHKYRIRAAAVMFAKGDDVEKGFAKNVLLKAPVDTLPEDEANESLRAQLGDQSVLAEFCDYLDWDERGFDDSIFTIENIGVALENGVVLDQRTRNLLYKIIETWHYNHASAAVDVFSENMDKQCFSKLLSIFDKSECSDYIYKTLMKIDRGRALIEFRNILNADKDERADYVFMYGDDEPALKEIFFELVNSKDPEKRSRSILIVADLKYPRGKDNSLRAKYFLSFVDDVDLNVSLMAYENYVSCADVPLTDDQLKRVEEGRIGNEWQKTTFYRIVYHRPLQFRDVCLEYLKSPKGGFLYHWFLESACKNPGLLPSMDLTNLIIIYSRQKGNYPSVIPDFVSLLVNNYPESHELLIKWALSGQGMNNEEQNSSLEGIVRSENVSINKGILKQWSELSGAQRNKIVHILSEGSYKLLPEIKKMYLGVVAEHVKGSFSYDLKVAIKASGKIKGKNQTFDGQGEVIDRAFAYLLESDGIPNYWNEERIKMLRLCSSEIDWGLPVDRVVVLLQGVSEIERLSACLAVEMLGRCNDLTEGDKNNLLPYVLNCVQHDESIIRAEAAFALRWIADEKHYNLLFNLFKIDEAVRKSLIRTLLAINPDEFSQYLIKNHLLFVKMDLMYESYAVEWYWSLPTLQTKRYALSILRDKKDLETINKLLNEEQIANETEKSSAEALELLQKLKIELEKAAE